MFYFLEALNPLLPPPPRQNYAIPESVSVVQTHSNRSKNKNVHTSNETVIIPKRVILKPRILYDLNQQPSTFRNL